jgi:1D-myo-inositol 3-kinase
VDFDFTVFNGAVSIQCDCAPQTTTFHNLYTNGSRQQMVYGLAAPLAPARIPPAWRSAELVHIGPVIGECEASLVNAFPPEAFIGITAQGWMRSLDREGRVSPRRWQPGGELLDRASAIVFSIDDIQGDWEVAKSLAAQTRLLAVTMGPRGGVLFVEGVAHPFAALTVTETDPTGAGDIFATVFFCKLAAGVRPVEAARFSACAASRSVERRGIAGVPCPEDFALCESLIRL